MSVPASSAPQGAAPVGTPLFRKAKAGRAEHQARAMSLAKSLRVTLPRVADELFEMSMSVIGVRSETVDGEGLADHLGAPGLLMMLDGPARRRGAAILDAPLVGALIQQQTMGKVLAQTDTGARPMTPTDAAIAAPFLDAFLARAAPVPEDPVEKQLIAGFSFGTWIEDLRILTMALDAPEYELIHLTLDIAGGLRQGMILLCMPKSIGREDELTQEGLQPNETGKSTAPRHALSDTVLNLHADLRIALSHMRMPLRELGALKEGDVLELANAVFDKVRVETTMGHPVGRGTLGQLDGMRAVQVEHADAAALPLRRRASDRGNMDLADISAPQTDQRQHSPDRVASAMPPLLDLPDFSETEDAAVAGGLPDLPELPELPELPDLPDLPDMSDLPDFDDLPELNTG